MSNSDAKLLYEELTALGLTEPMVIAFGALIMTTRADLGQFILNLRKFRSAQKAKAD